MLHPKTPFRKYGVPTLLTLLFGAIGLYFGLYLGRVPLFLYALTLPVPLLLLWLSWGTDSLNERIYPEGVKPDFALQQHHPWSPPPRPVPLHV